MKPKEFKPTFREDGALDPECLEQAGLRWTKQWLEARFSGQDPQFPMDKRSEEDPEALVVGLLRDAGLMHPASGLIGQAVLSMLDKGRKAAPKALAFWPVLLRLCQRTRIPKSSTWFTEELKSLASDRREAEERWGGYERIKEIVFAATVQAPGLPTSASRASWSRVLKEPRYSTLALLGLSKSFQDQVSNLKAWWVNCLVAERQQELNQMLFTALRTEGEATVLSVLKSAASSLPSDLKDSIDANLQQHGAKPAFAEAAELRRFRTPLRGAICGAAQKPELVLAAA